MILRILLTTSRTRPKSMLVVVLRIRNKENRPLKACNKLGWEYFLHDFLYSRSQLVKVDLNSHLWDSGPVHCFTYRVNNKAWRWVLCIKCTKYFCAPESGRLVFKSHFMSNFYKLIFAVKEIIRLDYSLFKITLQAWIACIYKDEYIYSNYALSFNQSLVKLNFAAITNKIMWGSFCDKSV